MEKASSTSSSDPGALRVLLCTVAIVGCAELGVRFWHPDGTIPYVLGNREYSALQPELDAFGARNVSAVGSSHTREAVLSPVLSDALTAFAGRPITVGNYALAGAGAEEVSIVVSRLLQARPRPELVLYTVTPRQLSTKSDGASSNARLLYRVSDFWRSRAVHGGSLDQHLPEALRNELAEHSHLFRLRTEVFEALTAPGDSGSWAALADMAAQREQPSQSPMRGGLPPWKQGKHKNRSAKVSEKRVIRYLRGRFADPEWPRTRQAQFVERTIASCKAAGVPFVLAELPMSPLLLAHMPEGAYAAYLRYLEELSATQRVPLITLEELDLSLQQTDFLEQSHMNYRGAEAYSRALASRLWQKLRTSGPTEAGRELSGP